MLHERREILEMLRAHGHEQDILYRQARDVRDEFIGSRATIRGLVEISNICRGGCDYCGMRRQNEKLVRYELAQEEVYEYVKQIKSTGIGTVFLQSGEYPQSTELVENVLPRIKSDLDMYTILCLGNKTRGEFKRLKDAGADAYILKFETSDPVLHQRIRHQDLSERLRCMDYLKDLGYDIGTGMIVGLPGQTTEDLANDLLLVSMYKPAMASVSPFIPSGQTPFADKSRGDVDLTLNTIALLRILTQSAHIPTVSALQLIDKGGQIKGFNAGADVITVNFSPPERRADYPIYSAGRFVVGLEHAKDVVVSAGLQWK